MEEKDVDEVLSGEADIWRITTVVFWRITTVVYEAPLRLSQSAEPKGTEGSFVPGQIVARSG